MLKVNRRTLRKKLGSRSSRRQGTKHGKNLKTRPKTLLALAIEKLK
jgi:hypothetical protein